jgi:hypothetical protein
MGLILLAMYNIVLFAVAGFVDHEAPFWISYVFVMLAFGMIAVSAFYLGESGLALRDWLFGFPIIRHCAIYLTLELVLSIVFMALEYDIGWVLPFVAQVLLLGIYGILVLTCCVSKNTISEIGKKVQEKTRYIAVLQADVELLCMKCTDGELKAKLQKLAEDIRFSDPMSSPALKDVENALTASAAACSKALDDGDIALAGELSDKISQLLTERNMKCKALK